jgi:hypothetical protein
MEQITIEYDTKNSVAKKLIEFIISSDLVKVKKVKKSALDEAIEDVKTGNVTTCKDFEDYKRITREILENV